MDSSRTLTDTTCLIVDSGNDRIVYWDAASRQILGSMPIEPGTWFGLCVHRSRIRSDEVHVAMPDKASGVVKIFSVMPPGAPTGDEPRGVRTIGHGQLDGPTFTGLFRPPGAGAELLVVDHRKHRIAVFDWESGAYLRQIGVGHGGEPGQMRDPGSFAVWTSRTDPSDTQVVVADSTNGRLQFFRWSDGAYLREITQAGTKKLVKPSNVYIHVPAAGSDADALLITVGDHRPLIHIYALVTGEYLRCIPANRGSEDARCSFQCYGMTCYRPSGEPETETQLIVTDTYLHQLDAYNLYSGAHMGTAGDRQFFFPRGMCLLSSDPEDADPYLLK
jgi:hypothetical protein